MEQPLITLSWQKQSTLAFKGSPRIDTCNSCSHIFLAKANHMVLPETADWGDAILPRARKRERN